MDLRGELSSAGAAILQIDEEGIVTRAMLISLPTSFKQDAAVAEQVAAVMAVMHSAPGVTIWTDCEAVLANASDPSKADHYATPAAGLWRQTDQAQQKVWGKVEAHRTFKKAIQAGQLQQCRGTPSLTLWPSLQPCIKGQPRS